jgi:ribosomal-protein-alanine N-acetyltransferase
MDYPIFTATIRDLGELRMLEKICFEQDAWPFLDLVAVLTFPNIVRLKAVDEGRMIGFIAGDPRPAEGVGWIATVGVHPAYRRRGIGTALLAACEKQMGQQFVRLSVRASNVDAIRLYEREGYLRVDRWKKYYNDGEEAIVMERLVE